MCKSVIDNFKKRPDVIIAKKKKDVMLNNDERVSIMLLLSSKTNRFLDYVCRKCVRPFQTVLIALTL